MELIFCACAERAIAYLRAHELGRATFLPLDTLGKRTGRAVYELPERPGVIAWAHHLVETAPEYAGAIAFLVGRTLIVETLEVGVRLVRGDGFRDTVVTLDGDEIRGGGAMTGGRYQRERSILSRRAQARTLSEQIPQLRERLGSGQAAADAALAESAAATRERDEAHRIERELAVALRGAHARTETAQTEGHRLETEVATLLRRALERECETAVARERLVELDRPAIDPNTALAERGRLEAALSQARETIARAQNAERAVAAEIASAREAVAGLLAKHDGAQTRLGLLDADRERAERARAAMIAQIGSLSARIVELQAALAGANERAEALDGRHAAARRDREAAATRGNELEGELRVVQHAERDSSHQSEAARLRLAEIDAELGMLAAQFAQHPATAQECLDVEARYANEQGDITPELQGLREELARLQNVNLNAESEIAELAERERFLKEQLDDLTRAREMLLASKSSGPVTTTVCKMATLA